MKNNYQLYPAKKQPKNVFIPSRCLRRPGAPYLVSKYICERQSLRDFDTRGTCARALIPVLKNVRVSPSGNALVRYSAGYDRPCCRWWICRIFELELLCSARRQWSSVRLEANVVYVGCKCEYYFCPTIMWLWSLCIIAHGGRPTLCLPARGLHSREFLLLLVQHTK